jgi:ABC-2 type transport system ATP-binding protein
VRLDAVGKRYGLRQPWIVRDVSLEVPAGRLIRMEGRNGSGKSTLLRVLAGACVPSAGRVTGRPATGYVPERFPPGLPFSPRGYLTHLGRVHGMRDTDLARQVDECLDRLGAQEYAGVPMRSLSKGMCQKVAVAQALLPRPGLLVLDEAWTGLDAEARDVLDDEVCARLADGGTVVFVDHDPRRLAGRISERWRVGGGAVRVIPEDQHAGVAVSDGPADVAAADRPAEVPAIPVRTDGAAGPAPAEPGVTVIELTGLGDVARSSLAALAGVLSVRALGERVLVSVESGSSDAVLRTVLASGEGVHVRSVDPSGSADSRQESS